LAQTKVLRDAAIGETLGHKSNQCFLPRRQQGKCFASGTFRIRRRTGQSLDNMVHLGSIGPDFPLNHAADTLAQQLRLRFRAREYSSCTGAKRINHQLRCRMSKQKDPWKVRKPMADLLQACKATKETVLQVNADQGY